MISITLRELGDIIMIESADFTSGKGTVVRFLYIAAAVPKK